MGESFRGSPWGIVLAGGASRRLRPAGGQAGVRKEWLAVAGRTLLERVATTLDRCCAGVVVVAAPDEPLPSLPRGVVVVRDSRPGAGPLAGIADGLETLDVSATHAFIAACDIPLLSPAVVGFLNAEAVTHATLWTVPVVGGHPQVLASVMARGLRPRLEAWLAGGRRDPRGLLESLAGEPGPIVRLVPEHELAAVDPGLESFRDVDTPEDWERLRRQLTYGSGGEDSYTRPP